MRSKIALAALAATAAFASPAMAQTTDTEQAFARGTVLEPLQLTWVQDLEFGTILSPALVGDVLIDADSGNRTADPSITLIGLDPGQRAVFNGFGTDGRQVQLTINPVAVLTGPGADIQVLDMDLDSGGGTTQLRTIPVGGAFVVGVGAEFRIAPAQANGTYSGQFSVTATYF